MTLYYDQNGVQKLPQYLQNNSDVDIFMTDDHNIKRPTEEDYYVGDRCLDLSKEDIDFSAMLPDALAEGTLNGEVLRLPVAINPCGIVVNKTLLKNEGLEVPQNYREFLTVLKALKALKDKGYTPLQGSQEHLDSMAAIKGMPSAAVEGKNERYQGLVNAKNIQERFINDGSIPQITCEQFMRVCKDYGAGAYTSPEEANEAFETLRNS